MDNMIVLRTITEMSFAGELCKKVLEGENRGILLKPSPNSEVKVWCPIDEIKCVILPDGQVFEPKDLAKLG